MNRLNPDRRAAVLRALVDGASVRTICRMTEAAKGTVLRVLADVGAACVAYERAQLVNLLCRNIQCDEIWSFVGTKERTIAPAEKNNGRGDVWTWKALCADTKLVPRWHLGARDADAAAFFTEDLASRLANPVQLTTEGHSA